MNAIRSTFACSLAALLLVSVAGAQWTRQNVATKAAFRGLSVVSGSIVWASGTGGTVIKTIDGGSTWTVMKVPGADKLDFRDIEAFDADTAYALSIGEGEASRIYKTVDGGKTWNEQFRNKNAKAFFDAVACWDKKNCIAMSDPVDGKFLLIQTKDGEQWTAMDASAMPPVQNGEAAFAASGTCLITRRKSGAFLISGGTAARVFRTGDRGKTWQAAETPITRGTAGSGIFSIAFRNDSEGVLAGGNYEKPEDAAGSLAFTNDGGKTWSTGEGLSGYRSAVAYVDSKTVLAAGTNGTDISEDGGRTWKKVGSENLNSVAARGRKAVWGVGPNGLVVKWK